MNPRRDHHVHGLWPCILFLLWLLPGCGNDKPNPLQPFDDAIEKASDPNLEYVLIELRKNAQSRNPRLRLGQFNLKPGHPKIKQIPPEIGLLKHLTHLTIQGNDIDSLPPEIGQLKNLTLFRLRNNQLKSIPAQMGNLDNLKTLDLAGNQLENLPSEIGKIQSLKYLDLDNNQFASLPPTIGRLRNLTRLSLMGNQMSELSSEIGALTNLEGLNLARNRLAAISPEIKKLQNLQWLSLLKNPIPDSQIKHLEPLINLKRIDIEQTSLTKAAVQALQNALPNCKFESIAFAAPG